MATGSDAVLVRVLIYDLPDLQADVIARLVSDQPDLVVVGDGEAEPLARLDDLSPDVVIVSPLLNGHSGQALARLRSAGDVGVLAIDATRGEIVRVVIVPDDHAWPEKVVDAIRSAAPQRTARHRRNQV